MRGAVTHLPPDRLCGYREAATSRVIPLYLEFSAQEIQHLLMNGVKLSRETLGPVRHFDAGALKSASHRRSEHLPLFPAAQNRPAITLFAHGIRMAKDVDFYDSLQKKTSLYLVRLRWLNMVLMGLRYGYPNVHLQRR